MRDSKSRVARRVGSSPTTDTKNFISIKNITQKISNKKV